MEVDLAWQLPCLLTKTQLAVLYGSLISASSSLLNRVHAGPGERVANLHCWLALAEIQMPVCPATDNGTYCRDGSSHKNSW